MKANEMLVSGSKMTILHTCGCHQIGVADFIGLQRTYVESLKILFMFKFPSFVVCSVSAS
jgi:hypothetical protein